MSNVVKLYTDGGCIGNQSDSNVGGWGAYMTCGEIKREIKGSAINTTNNIMELKGCVEGLKAIKNKSIPVEVYLDSAYVLNGITTWIKGWKQKGWRTANKKPVLNKELWIELDQEREKFSDIKFIKVKGHSGEEGNENADRLCNEAMDDLENNNQLEEIACSNMDMQFLETTEKIWCSINKSFNMSRLLLNYVEENEFKKAIEEGLR